MSRAAVLCAIAACLPGCLLDRSGTGLDVDAGPGLDAGDDAGTADAGSDAGSDAGFDGGHDAGFDACVPAPELCNGADDDCDPSTPDGSGEAWFGLGCDVDDPDACAGGLLGCTAGVMACGGDLPDGREELCDGVDNDCNPGTLDGAGDPRLAMPCDGADTDLCAAGLPSCGVTGFACLADDADLPGELEVCDGIENDCDPATLDGASDPMRGMPCDDPADADRCAEGTFACSGGALVCTGDDGDQPDETELCDGMDNDCDPGTIDGAGDARVGAPCDGADSDRCDEGTGLCTAGAFSCTDATGGSVETCNGRDDECNGTVDDSGADCECTQRHRAGVSYLFCNDWLDRKRWTSARDWCRARGYDLVVVNDAAEQAWLDANVGDGGASYWIGYHDRTTEGTWAWSRAGTGVTYTNWNAGEPNDSSDEDCAVLNPFDTGASGVAGGWNDVDCNDDDRYVCEAPP